MELLERICKKNDFALLLLLKIILTKNKIVKSSNYYVKSLVRISHNFTTTIAVFILVLVLVKISCHFPIK